MSPAQETWEDATTRLETLQHAVVEAQAARDATPGDAGAQRKLDMARSIRDVAAKALVKAEAALKQSLLDRAGKARHGG